MLIQRQNIAFKGFRVKPEAKPYLKNALPHLVNSDLNFLLRDPERILSAFKKRMERMAKALEEKQTGVDIVLLSRNGLPELNFKNKNNKKIGGSLILTELVPTKKQRQVEIFTVNDSLNSLNLILERTHKWIEGTFPKTTRKPRKILAEDLTPMKKWGSMPKILLGKMRKTKCPDTLTGVVYKVFGQ